MRIIIYFKPQWAAGYGERKSASDKVPITFLIAFPQICFKVLLTDLAPTANDATVGVVISATETNFLWNSYFLYNTSMVSYHDSFYYFAIGK